MSTTAAQLITPALRMAGISNFEMVVPGADTYGELIPRLNSFLSSLNLDGWTVYEKSIIRPTLSPLQSTYFLGPTSGDWQYPRPISLSSAALILTGTTPEIRRPVRIITTAEEWQEITTQETSSAWPDTIYCDYEVSDAKIYVYPMPSEENDLELVYRTALRTDFAAKTDETDLEEGMEEVITTNFALVIAAMNPRIAMVSQDTRDLARKSLERMRTNHHRPKPYVSELVTSRNRWWPSNL